MTARADISNHRRKVLEERSQLGTGSYGPRPYGSAPRVTAWEKGEALPPFYREVLDEGVRRGDVVSREEHHATVEEWRLDLASLTQHIDEVANDWRDRVERLEAQLREAEGRIERARERVETEFYNGNVSEAAADALDAILAGTEKEGDRGA